MKLFKMFIQKSPILALLLSVFFVILSSIVTFSTIYITTVLLFIVSLITSSRILTYRLGKTFFIIDTTWNLIEKRSCNRDEAQKKYKEHSLKVASVTYPIMLLLFIAWCIIEIIIRR